MHANSFSHFLSASSSLASPSFLLPCLCTPPLLSCRRKSRTPQGISNAVSGRANSLPIRTYTNRFLHAQTLIQFTSTFFLMHSFSYFVLCPASGPCQKHMPRRCCHLERAYLQTKMHANTRLRMHARHTNAHFHVMPRSRNASQ